MDFFPESPLTPSFPPHQTLPLGKFNPIWGIDCKHYFFVKNIDDSHDNLAIDDDGFTLGTDESFNDREPPVFLGMLNSLMLSGARQLIGLSYPTLIRTSSFCIFSYTSWR